MNFTKKNQTNCNNSLSSKLFSYLVLPLFLLISAVVIIGSGCGETDDDDENFEETDNVAIKSELTIN